MFAVFFKKHRLPVHSAKLPQPKNLTLSPLSQGGRWGKTFPKG